MPKLSPHLDDFASRLLAWFDDHGRKDLPWQQNITPYRVWVSEIMLQQTQVKTVIPYYERFMARFPTVLDLANAEEDEVLHHWSGLGYYARARNLHKTARLVRDDFGGQFPQQIELIESLPGIGRSTAGAICSISWQQPTPILDGNVKRVLARYHAISGWPGQSDVLTALWERAEAHTPNQRNGDYTQAIMDLGATLCTRSKPACVLCPFFSDCQGRLSGHPDAFPGKKPSKITPVKSTRMFILRWDDQILLEKRPSQGIWGGLWSLPEADPDTNTPTWLATRGYINGHDQPLPCLRHTFSHYHLDIHPTLIDLDNPHPGIMEDGRQLWYNLRQPQNIGLAAPVSKLLASLPETPKPSVKKAQP